jgi:hypothetical protein
MNQSADNRLVVVQRALYILNVKSLLPGGSPRFTCNDVGYVRDAVQQRLAMGKRNHHGPQSTIAALLERAYVASMMRTG